MSLVALYNIPPLSILHKYFYHTEHYSTLRFIIELTLICFVLKILSLIFFGIIFSLFNYNPTQDLSFEQGMVEKGWLYILILTPIFAAFETLTGQWLVIWVVSKFSKSRSLKIWLSAIVFAALHVEPVLMAAVFPIGIILAWTFILYRKKSKWSAFWVTTTIHTFHNYIALLLVWFSIR